MKLIQQGRRESEGARWLRICGCELTEGPPAKPDRSYIARHRALSGEAYAIAISSLMELNGMPAQLQAGDRLKVMVAPLGPVEWNLSAGRERDIQVEISMVDQPVIAPPAAVYGLATLDKIPASTATPALFASAPLPQSLEFPDLKRDLVRGHVRRRAVFLWRFAPRTALASVGAALMRRSSKSIAPAAGRPPHTGAISDLSSVCL